MSEFQIYKASAGAGKTFRLAVEYLKIALNSPLNYKYILAVTFTNKATTEMKYRVIQELYLLGRGKKTAYLEVLQDEMKLSAEELSARAQRCLKNILHDYSRLSISTIDSFFQRVIKAFSREMGMNTAYQVDLNDEQILEEAVDELLLSVDDNRDLLEWLKQFAREKIQEGKGWNLKREILELGSQIYNEAFKELSETLHDKLNDKLFIRSYRSDLQQIISQYENKLKQTGQKGLQLISEAGLRVADFKFGATGAANSFNRMLQGELKPGPRLLAAAEDVSCLFKAKGNPEVEHAARKIQPLLAEIVSFHQKNFRDYQTARLIVEQLYTLGILVDLQEMVRKVTREKGVVLISESGSLLKQIIADSETPFVYEKTGVYYRHFMIDEFQDTSGLQWNNFKPLIGNSLSENHLGMVVGDVKQAIYRWRSGDWNLLASQVKTTFAANGFSEKQLIKNWRSAGQVIRFNNRIFQIIPAVLQQHFSNELAEAGEDQTFLAGEIGKIYQESVQEVAREAEDRDGYIRMRFFLKKKKSMVDAGEDSDEEPEVRQLALDDLVVQIKRVQEAGASASEIAVLVRRKSEAALVADRLLAEKENAGERYNFNVLSGESLYVKNASSVSFILSLLALLIDPADQLELARANYLFYSEIEPALASIGRLPVFQPVEGREQLKMNFKEPYAPDLAHQFESVQEDGNELYAFFKSDLFKASLGSRNLQEAIFKLCDMFNLFELKEELAYLQAFIDQANAFMRNKNADLSAFLSWWEEQGQKKTISVSEDLDAIRIQTIHKAKGLEYNYVFIPFCDWSLEVSSQHASILWCRPLSPPFNRLELVPVRFAGRMKESLFSREYLTEKMNNYIDNLNLLYVAFTRARKALFIWSSWRENALSSAGDLLLAGIKQDPAYPHNNQDQWTLKLADFFNDDLQILEAGTLKVSEKSPGKSEGGIHLQDFRFTDFSSYLRLRKNYENFFDSKDHSGQNINKGRLIHEILAKIKHADELGRAVNELVFQGMLTQAEAAEIEIQLSKLIADPEVKNWFDGSYRVVNERNILTGKSGLKRPDRIMLSGDQVIVVDYKSGEKELDKYAWQIRNYMRALEACGYRAVSGFIWYTRSNKRIEVFI